MDGLLGNASEIEASQLQAECSQLLTSDERVEKGLSADSGHLCVHQQAADIRE
jgi:hypothetical protein